MGTARARKSYQVSRQAESLGVEKRHGCQASSVLANDVGKNRWNASDYLPTIPKVRSATALL